MELTSEATRDRLAAFIASAAGVRKAEILDLGVLSGGAIQENFRLTVRLDSAGDGVTDDLVLRTSPVTTVADSMTRAQEFRVLVRAFKAGVTVPEPLWLCTDIDVIGQEFYLMRRIGGTAAGHLLVRSETPRPTLAEGLGRELGRLHRIRPGEPELDFLEAPRPSPAQHAIAKARTWLDRLGDPQPVLEYGLRQLEQCAPSAAEVVLCHRDFRTGNYMVEDDRITGILDWEFAGWGDPMEDLGWFCAPCWRFGRLEREAGGIAEREPFYAGYEAEAGRRVEPAAVAWWEAMAAVRWALIALQQGMRHVSGAEPSLELALTGRKVPEMELDLLLSLEAMTASGTSTGDDG